MTYQEIKAKHQNAYSKIMEDAGVFWAFNNDQFKEGLKRLKANNQLLEGEKLTRWIAGGFLPSKNVDAMMEKLQEVDKQQKAELKAAKDEKEKAILYELNNHECFYRGNGLDDVADIFKGVYTKQDVLKVFKKYNSINGDNLINSPHEN